ncbi:hypothetical protein QF028_006547 [Neobacillus sp. B4I6]
MSFKDRNESDEIKILRFLNSRMKLAEKDKIRFHNLVKGFEGDRFYALPKKEYKNPLHQLQRSESLLRQLLESLGYRIPIEAYVVFINPHLLVIKSHLMNRPCCGLFPLFSGRILLKRLEYT